MPITPTDTHRGLKFESPLGDTLICQSMNGREQLSRLFTYHLDLLSLDRNVAFKDIVGQRCTVTTEMPDGSERYFDGFVTEFRYTGTQGQFASYQATIKPWLWFLSRTADCKVFQNQTVPDIVTAVFRDNGMSDFENRLSDSYREWEYCVQYRETDLNFISRLLEQEGIYYYFEHVKGKHTLVLCDGINAHQPFPGYETVPYFPPTANEAIRERDHIQVWSRRQEIVPASYALKDYDFRKPRVDLSHIAMIFRDHAYPIESPDIFDYPGEFQELPDAERYTVRRFEEQQAQFDRVHASGDARGMSAGYTFKLDGYPRQEENTEYLITSVSHQASVDVLETSGGGTGAFYRFELEALNTIEQFRPERVTAKPIVQGNLSAIVVGPDNEEIWCDEYGRVKVQFHWDRYGKFDENSSCWIRVSQLWAGQGWGGIHIPRIGHEVIVGFLEGDPDRPMIMGRVYNAVNMPPYELPSNKTQSGIKSRSSLGGSASNFNELRFEDKKNKEEVYFQAEKDLNSLVKNSETRRVGNSRTSNIGTGHKTVAKVVEDTTVHAGRQTTIKGNDTLDAATEVAATEGRTVTVHNGNHKLTVKKKDQEMIIELGNHKTTTQVGDISRTALVGAINDTATRSIKLQVGSNAIVIDPSGIKIMATTIQISASTALNLGASTVNMTGGIVNLSGGMVKIN